jgi:hypothetical protein
LRPADQATNIDIRIQVILFNVLTVLIQFFGDIFARTKYFYGGDKIKRKNTYTNCYNPKKAG